MLGVGRRGPLGRDADPASDTGGRPPVRGLDERDARWCWPVRAAWAL